MTRESLELRSPASMVLILVLATLVVVAPWPYGSVGPGWALLLRSLVLAALILTVALRSQPLGVRTRVVGYLGLVGAIGLLTCLPWPGWLVGWLLPPVAEASAGSAIESSWMALTVSLSTSVATAVSWLGVAATLLAASFVRRSRLRNWLLAGVVGGACLQVALGQIPALRSSSEILGIQFGGYPRFHGSFVNPNHLAFFLMLAFSVAVAMGLWSFSFRGWRRPALFLGSASLAASLLGGVLMTGSRSALLGLGASAFVQVGFATWLLIRRRAVPVRWLLPASVIMILFAALTLQGQLNERLAEASVTRELGPGFVPGRPFQENAAGRTLAVEATRDLWRMAPILGTGLGSFRQAFPLVQPASFRTNYWHAHNDLVELLATAGIVGVLLVSASLLSLLVVLEKGLEAKRGPSTKMACFAACGALAGAGVQSWFDFGLVIPSNALLLAVICGLAMGSALGEERRPRGHSTSPDRGERIFPRRA